MKISIESDPKEIAALEQALKDGAAGDLKRIKISVPDGTEYHVDGGNTGTNGIGPATILVITNSEGASHHRFCR